MAKEREFFLIDELEIVEPSEVSDPSNLNEVLGNLASSLVQCLKSNIDVYKIKDTGELSRSIKMPVKLFGNELVATLYLEDYFDYVNKGVKGIGGERKTEGGRYITGPRQAWKLKNTTSPYQFRVGPKVSMIKQWAEKRGLNAYAVRTSIAHKGIKARPFYDDCIEQSFSGAIWDRFKTQISVTSSKNITRQLKSSLVSKEKVKSK